MQRVASLVDTSYAHEHGIYGQGINVAVVDSGIARHGDFEREYVCPYTGRVYGGDRLVAAYDAVGGRHEFYDDNGHGTHVAGIIGGYGGFFTGIAPACRFISVKVLDRYGSGKIENVVNGLEWILDNKDKYNIRVVNISVGTGKDKKYDEDSKLVSGVDMLWDAGMVVLAAAGNNGPEKGSIGAPGISRKIITVGASDDNIMCYDRSRGYMRDYSGRGPTAGCIIKPDVVAPGAGVKSCSYTGKHRYSVKSGTSMATPVVSGAVALLLSKYGIMGNRDVKIRIKDTAVNLGLPHDRQGWGLINVRTLLEGKRTW